MRNLKFLIIITMTLSGYSQPNTEVFLFDIDNSKSDLGLSNYKNISNNDGYDNQPSFLDNETILFSSTRKGQTDIVRYSIKYDTKIWINFTEGSEYSPLKIPNQNAVSAIRLEKDGAQKLYRYNLSNGESEVLIEDIVIGYHVWFNENILVSSVLDEGGLSLYSTFFDENKSYKYQQNIGRSLHKVPNSNLVSFISKQDSNLWEIKTVDPTNGSIASVMGTLPEQEDMCWLPDGTILMGKDDVLYKFKKGNDVDWVEVASLKKYNITNITRMAVNMDASKLVLVGEGGLSNKKTIEDSSNDNDDEIEPTLENISWISGNWKGNAMGGVAEENWSEPLGDSMMASFKLVKDDKVVFYEIEIIREVNNTLILQLKHFNNDLKGWETKDETVDFPLKTITKNKVIFEGMTFEKHNENEMTVHVDVKMDDGSTQVMSFKYTKE